MKPFKVETLKEKIETMSKVMEVCVPEAVRHSFLEGMKLLENKNYEKALALDPNFKEAREALEAIELGKV